MLIFIATYKMFVGERKNYMPNNRRLSYQNPLLMTLACLLITRVIFVLKENALLIEIRKRGYCNALSRSNNAKIDFRHLYFYISHIELE